MQIENTTIDAFQSDGAVLIKGLFANHIEQLREGIAQNLEFPSEYAAENLTKDQTGRFFDDYCNWTRIPHFQDVIMDSPAAHVAAQLMQSQTVQIFHDHVLVKESDTSMCKRLSSLEKIGSAHQMAP